jgi:hypothetical protein
MFHVFSYVYWQSVPYAKLWVEHSRIWKEFTTQSNPETENMIIGPAGPGTEEDCAVEDQGQFARNLKNV